MLTELTHTKKKKKKGEQLITTMSFPTIVPSVEKYWKEKYLWHCTSYMHVITCTWNYYMFPLHPY